jgi:hypothetical protein
MVASATQNTIAGRAHTVVVWRTGIEPRLFVCSAEVTSLSPRVATLIGTTSLTKR